MKTVAWLGMGVALLGNLAAARGAPLSGEVRVAGSVATVEIDGEAAVALYDHLSIAPEVSENQWNHEVLTKRGPGIACVRDLVQEGVVVQSVYTCTLNVAPNGQVKR